MPQRCLGLADPAGIGPPSPCIFAADGLGGAARRGHKRDGASCAFCCPDAFARAYTSRIGKRNFTKRLKKWWKTKSPVYEAAFDLGMPGAMLPPDLQTKLRRRAGERPKFNCWTSWLHKRKSRLEALLCGKPILEEPQLSRASSNFLVACNRQSHPRKIDRRLRMLRLHVRRYDKIRQKAKVRGWSNRAMRREWWKVRRELQKRISLLLPAAFPPAVQWATEEGMLKA